MENFKLELCSGLTDREVIRLSLSDMEYFACVVLKYEKRLLVYIRRISQCTQEEAEDILQDTFVKIWKNLNGYDPGLTFESWVFRITHNETISHWRKKTSYSKNQVERLDDGRLNFRVEDDSLDAFENEKAFGAIEVVLPLLRQEYREVLVLKYLENKKYDEISDILKIPEGTVATRISRAKKSFRELALGKFDSSIFK